MLSISEERRGGRHASGERRGLSPLVVVIVAATVVSALGTAAQGTVSVVSAGQRPVIVIGPNEAEMVDAQSEIRRAANLAARKLDNTLRQLERMRSLSDQKAVRASITKQSDES